MCVIQELVRNGNRGECKEACIHWRPNLLWQVPGLDVFKTPQCKMHALDHGVFVHVLNMVVTVVQRHSVLSTFDQRWGSVTNFPKMKRFDGGISNKSYVTASEHRDMARCLPFVVRGLIPNPDSDTLEHASVTYLRVRQWMEEPDFTVSGLQFLDRTIEHFLENFTALRNLATESSDGRNHGIIKVHHLLHWSDHIREFGVPSNYNGETWEKAHVHFVKDIMDHVGPRPELQCMRRNAMSFIHGVGDKSHRDDPQESPSKRIVKKRKHGLSTQTASQLYGHEQLLRVQDCAEPTKTLLQCEQRTLFTDDEPSYSGGLGDGESVHTYSRFKCSATEGWISRCMYVSFDCSEITAACHDPNSSGVFSSCNIPSGSQGDRQVGEVRDILQSNGGVFIVVKWCPTSTRSRKRDGGLASTNKVTELCELLSTRSSKHVLIRHCSTYVLHCVPDYAHRLRLGEEGGDVFVNEITF